MFEIKDNGARGLGLTGRFDASHAEGAREIFNAIEDSRVVDFAELEYISSAGLGVLLATEKRLRGSGRGLKLVNLSPHIRELFRITGFDRIFQIE